MLRSILKNGALAVICCVAVAAACGPSGPQTPDAAAGEVNIYSARHYDADEQLYSLFEQETGIKVNRIEANADLLIERLEAEGEASPADVVLLVDAGNYWRATQRGLLAPVQSEALNSEVPERLRDPQGRWFGFAKRARVIVYDRERIRPEQVASYEALAGDAMRGKVCARTASNIYNLSLMAALIDAWGAERATEWARGVAANFARAPQGGDTDQIVAVAAGECQVALVNHYYLVRMMRSDNPEERAQAARVGLVFPDQAEGLMGTHVNISGGAVAAHAPNRANAVRFLEFLAGPEAQRIFAQANDEFAVNAAVSIDNPELAGLGAFREAATPLATLGENQPAAQAAFDRAGWR